MSLAILTGGRSQRLETDKGLFCANGEDSLIAHSINRLGSNFAQILIVLKSDEQHLSYDEHLRRQLNPEAFAKLRFCVDRSERFAALEGLACALSECASTRLFLVGVDQLALRAQHLKALVKHSYDGAAHFVSKHTHQPMPSLWKTAHLDRIKLLLSSGSLSLQNALEACGSKAIIPDDSWLQEINFNANHETDIRSYFGTAAYDRFARRLIYLRLSLTESCNMSCGYCLPNGFSEWKKHRAILSFDEVKNIMQGFRYLGFRKLRLTGGEPTLYPKIERVIEHARMMGFDQIALTTNGTLIKDLSALSNAGLDRINISLDSLDPKTFETMTKSKDHARILRLIDQAIELGLKTKINVVLLRSQNASEISNLIEWALGKNLTLRFIELMPTKLNHSFDQSERVSNMEIRERLIREFSLSEDASPRDLNKGPELSFSRLSSPGKIGLISPLSCNFCDQCNRLRVTARGKLKLCLFGDHDHRLTLDDPLVLAHEVRTLISEKKKGHQLETRSFGNVSTFRTIGG